MRACLLGQHVLTRVRRLLPPAARFRDGRIDADEVEQVFKQLGHKCKRVRDSRARTRARVNLCTGG